VLKYEFFMIAKDVWSARTKKCSLMEISGSGRVAEREGRLEWFGSGTGGVRVAGALSVPCDVLSRRTSHRQAGGPSQRARGGGVSAAVAQAM
jgi:hypothetical protein